MKKVSLLLAFVTVVFAVHAQLPFNLGLKGGFSTSKVRFDRSQFDEGNINNFHVGAFARVNIKKFHIQPEAYFTSKGGKVKLLDGNRSFDLNTVDVPVLLGYRIIKLPAINLRLNAGPVFSFVTSKDVGIDELDKQDVKSSFAGIQYGVGADFLFLTLDLRLENSLGSIVKSSDVGNAKSRAFLVSLGFKIL